MAQVKGTSMTLDPILARIDADQPAALARLFELLRIPSISTTQMRRIVKQMEASIGDEKEYLTPLTEFLEITSQSTATLMNGLYTLMDKDGYYYAGWGTSVYKVADLREGDVYSPIEIVQSYDLRVGLPEDQRDKISRIMGFAMTYDGYLAVAMPGIIAVMDRDFGGMEYILLEGEAVDNSISVDYRGGIYIVTSVYMRKVVWDGQKLSDQEADGAWKSEYDYVPNPKAMSRGNGYSDTPHFRQGRSRAQSVANTLNLARPV